MMVPVRTWQQRQQLVEYHRSHGEIIIFLLVGISSYIMNAALPQKMNNLVLICLQK